MTYKDYHIGDIVLFGSSRTVSEQKMEWKILAINGIDALLTTCHAVSAQPYHTEDLSVTWEECSLRFWLNHEFLKSHFSESERSKIIPIMPPDMETQISFDVEGADKVFILSQEETERYFGQQENRLLFYHRDASGAFPFSVGLLHTCHWWIRGKTKEINGRYCASVCDNEGSLGGFRAMTTRYIAVRPAIWVETCDLQHAQLPQLDNMNIRMKMKDEDDTITSFANGYENQQNVLARFVDYETREEYVLFYDEYSLRNPRIARVMLDYHVDPSIRKKAELLYTALTRNSVDQVMSAIQRKTDENRVDTWMKQMAWSPSPGNVCVQIPEGTVIQFGRMKHGKKGEKQPINWIVLRCAGNKALLITEKGIKSDTFMNDMDDDEECIWKNSQIRKWLNSVFYNASFTQKEKHRIQTCVTECGDFLGRIGKEALVHDKVFLLNDAEASVFFYSDEARKINGTPDDISIFRPQKDDSTGDWWWLRSPGYLCEYISCVDSDGKVYRHGLWAHSDVCAIRPAILIELPSLEPDLDDPVAYCDGMDGTT